jgi:hypothetical protein|nr:MAG TPA: hypothetical protein [Caudoviricetes sp.]
MMTNELKQQEHFVSSVQYQPTSADLIKVITSDCYQLERLATQYKQAHDWNGALACLYKAKNNYRDIDDPQYVVVALRLSLYLQGAGKFEEAKFELQSLINELDTIAELKMRHHSDDKDYGIYIESTKNNLLSEIFDTARKIYKRENLVTESNDFANKASQFRLSQQANFKYLQEQRKIRLDEWKRERENHLNEYHQQSQKYKATNQLRFLIWVGLGIVAYYIIKTYL